MLKTPLIHPPLLEAIGRAGHSSRILIADGNYPHATKISPNARLIHLNVQPGLLSCTQVLSAVLSAVPIEAAAVMDYARSGPYGLDSDPPIWGEFEQLLSEAGQASDLDRIERFAFYDAASEPDVAVTIATGEQRIYANLLLTIGVVKPS